ncbi:recombinase family protein [Marinobacter sp. W-8]|uniref:recombinase family protein n=1 Tax=Marinobacter sp. W-8 TaxID=3369658 RepID=UPI0037C5F763
MMIRAYLRASTAEQDASRAKAELEQFVEEYGHRIVNTYMENESGAKLDRPELMRLMEDAHPGDVIVVEQIDRLARLNQRDWDTLKNRLSEKRLSIVSKDVPTSYCALKQDSISDEFTTSILQTVNSMLLDILAVMARKDYEDRRRRQEQGIASAKAKGRYRGRAPDIEKRERIAKMLESGFSYNDIQGTLKCSRKLISSVAKGERAIVQVSATVESS